MARDAFLRSINVELDVEEPMRLAHFRPTSKSAELVRRVFDPEGDRALLVVAPYGSGKSLTAGYLLHAVHNEPERFEGAELLLDSVASELEELDPELGKTLTNRLVDVDAKGISASLHGYAPSTVEDLKDSLREGMRRAGLGREARSLERIGGEESAEIEDLLATAVTKLRKAGRDHLLIVWDEFGRHLERLVADGRPSELLELQTLAEAVERTSDVQVTLLLLLHRSLMGYASNLPSEVKKEWSKVGGRFHVVQYVDDSLEMHRLLASVAEESRPGNPPFDTEAFREAAERVQAVGMFDRVEEGELAELLEKAWPLEPAALWLLPRVASRVAQHERTAFSFLNDSDLSAPVSPSDVYDYFRGEFRADSGPGGTHKPWLEAESALAKVEPDSQQAEFLKATFLLNLGLSGERGRTGRARLLQAVQGWDAPEGDVTEALDDLLDRKLLIHRTHSDQVMVWHGTDVDLRGRLEDEQTRLVPDFDLVGFLSEEMPAPVWRPIRHNAERGVHRYLPSRLVSVDGLRRYGEELELGMRMPGADGEVLYVLPRTEKEAREGRGLAQVLTDSRTFVAVAPETDALHQAALEVAALLQMQRDKELLDQDPLVQQELDHITDDARQALAPLLNRILTPGTEGADWYHLGRRIEPRNGVDFRRILSERMDDVFSKTPRILAEMVVRRRPTPVVVNARKKVELGFLERYGQEAVGIEGDFADKAIFRGVFLNTGLYRDPGEGHWSLATPDELEDEGLREVWAEVQEFLTSPGSKGVNDLTDRLVEPPYGVREGLLPLFMAAGLKAFPAPRSIRGPDGYVADLLPTAVEEMVRNSGEFTLDVVDLSKDQERFLRSMLERFGEGSDSEEEAGDLIRAVFDAWQSWWHQLPASARTTGRVSHDAKKLRRLVQADDPASTLLQAAPSQFAEDSEDLEDAYARIEAAADDLENVHREYVWGAKQALHEALSVRGIGADDDVVTAAKQWASYFPASTASNGLSSTAKAALRHMGRGHDSEEALLNALALLVTERSFQHWDDATVIEFSRRLRNVLEDIEHAALGEAMESEANGEVAEGLVNLGRVRLRLALRQLKDLAGSERVEALVEEEKEAITEPTSGKERR